jgi:hypothetical protein
VRTAKEVLSRSSSTYIHLPLIEDDLPLGREQLDRLARPVLDRTVALTRTVISGAVRDGTLTGVFLVGGSSRMPLVATLLHRAAQVSPIVIEQPELVVAEGSVGDHNHTRVPLAGPAPADLSGLSDSWPPIPADLSEEIDAAGPPPDAAAGPARGSAPVPAVSEPVATPPEAGQPDATVRGTAAVRAPTPAAGPAQRATWIAALFAVAAFAALLLLVALPHTQDNDALDYWDRLLSWPSVALLPAYLGWLAYRFATSAGRRTVASVLVHTVAFSALVLGAVELAGAGSEDVDRAKFAAVIGLAAIGVIMLLWPRRSATAAGRPVFGVADVAASIIAAVVYGFPNKAMDGPGGSLPPDSTGTAESLAISLLTTALAVFVLGAAVGVLLGRTRPALTKPLRISAGVLLLVCGAITAQAVKAHNFG